MLWKKSEIDRFSNDWTNKYFASKGLKNRRLINWSQSPNQAASTHKATTTFMRIKYLLKTLASRAKKEVAKDLIRISTGIILLNCSIANKKPTCYWCHHRISLQLWNHLFTAIRLLRNRTKQITHRQTQTKWKDNNPSDQRLQKVRLIKSDQMAKKATTEKEKNILNSSRFLNCRHNNSNHNNNKIKLEILLSTLLLSHLQGSTRIQEILKKRTSLLGHYFLQVLLR